MENSDYREIYYYIINFFDKVEKRKSHLPYNINVIDELHINENAHSRILIKLLQYCRNDNLPILESFKALINKKLSQDIHKLPINDETFPSINGQTENIDAFIEENDKKSYAIIIENKIYNATDQNNQIDRYVETAKQHGFINDNIYVVYLTNDGEKDVSDYSFNEAKETLDYKDYDNPGRFIMMNFKDDILKWLEQVVLPNSLLKEETLISALQQYIDYLKGMFKLREGDIIMEENIFDEIFQLNENTLEDKAKKIATLYLQSTKADAFNKGISAYQSRLINEMFMGFKKKLGEELPDASWNGSYKSDFSINFELSEIKIKGLNSKVNVEFERDGQSNNFMYNIGITSPEEGSDTEIQQLVKNEFSNDTSNVIVSNKWYLLYAKKDTISIEEYFKGLLNYSIINDVKQADTKIKEHLRKINLLSE